MQCQSLELSLRARFREGNNVLKSSLDRFYSGRCLFRVYGLRACKAANWNWKPIMRWRMCEFYSGIVQLCWTPGSHAVSELCSLVSLASYTHFYSLRAVRRIHVTLSFFLLSSLKSFPPKKQASTSSPFHSHSGKKDRRTFFSLILVFQPFYNFVTSGPGLPDGPCLSADSNVVAL